MYQHTNNFHNYFAPFCSRTHGFRDNEEQLFSPGINVPQILDQLVHTEETKKDDTRVLHRLDSSHGKCSYPGPEECFWCYLSASMQLFLPTLYLAVSPLDAGYGLHTVL